MTDDAWVKMPPEPFEYQGREKIADFLHHAGAAARGGRGTRLVPTRANGQPAFGHYLQDAPAGVGHGTGVLVLTLAGDRIAELIRFGGPDLLARFGLPRTLPW